MTIAELLVHTTATLYAGNAKIAAAELYARGRLSPDGHEIADAFAIEARAIVAAVYGEPCDDFDLPARDDLPPFPYGDIDGDPCARCGWPRSQHKAKP